MEISEIEVEVDKAHNLLPNNAMNLAVVVGSATLTLLCQLITSFSTECGTTKCITGSHPWNV